MLALVDTNTISTLIGSKSGFLGVVFSTVIGSIVMVPTFVAFSTANTLLNSGAGSSGGTVVFKISGSQLKGVLNNYNSKMNKVK